MSAMAVRLTTRVLRFLAIIGLLSMGVACAQKAPEDRLITVNRLRQREAAEDTECWTDETSPDVGEEGTNDREIVRSLLASSTTTFALPSEAVSLEARWVVASVLEALAEVEVDRMAALARRDSEEAIDGDGSRLIALAEAHYRTERRTSPRRWSAVSLLDAFLSAEEARDEMYRVYAEAYASRAPLARVAYGSLEDPNVAVQIEIARAGNEEIASVDAPQWEWSDLERAIHTFTDTENMEVVATGEGVTLRVPNSVPMGKTGFFLEVDYQEAGAGTTARREFVDTYGPDSHLIAKDFTVDEFGLPRVRGFAALELPPIVDGTSFEAVALTEHVVTGAAVVELTLTPSAGEIVMDATEAAVGGWMVILVDGHVAFRAKIAESVGARIKVTGLGRPVAEHMVERIAESIRNADE
jgi:hypothetical protein